MINKNNLLISILLTSNFFLLLIFELKIVFFIFFFQLLAILVTKQKYKKKLQNQYLKLENEKILSNTIKEEKLFNFFDQFPHSVFIIQKDLSIYYQNLFAKKIYGDNSNKDIISVIRDYDFISQVEKFKNNYNYNKFNWSKPLPNNQYFTTEIFNLSNFYVLTINEITTEKNKEEFFNENLSNLTHELKTPLSVIIGYLETIDLENISNKENQKYLEIINSKTFEMKDLIEQILKISEIELHPSQQVSIDLYASIQKTLESHSVLFNKKGINLIIDIEATKKILIDFTVNDFEFILNNLLSNALKYTPSGKNVYISAIKISHSTLSIEIKDEGIGIAQTDLDKITNKFFRADLSRNSDTGGHGLGLAIVDKLLSKNGHKLEFSSILGEGSIFKIELRLS